jgi:hypothetical protein
VVGRLSNRDIELDGRRQLHHKRFQSAKRLFQTFLPVCEALEIAQDANEVPEYLERLGRLGFEL